MKEIKFRGLTVKNEWVYGCYVTDYKYHHVISKENPAYRKQMLNIPVNPKSVGQYTGLKDCDGVEIYEKDILVCPDGDIWVVSFTNGSFVAADNNDELNYVHLDDYNFEVIGNIYENPELLVSEK